MSDVLADRDISAVFRFLKTRGFSRAAIAGLTGLSETRVREIIHGRQRVRDYEVFERIAAGLAIERGLLGLAYAPTAHTHTNSTEYPTGTGPRELAEHWTELLGMVAGRTNECGAPYVWKLTRRQLALIDAQRRSVADRGRELLAVQAKWTEFASWVADNLGYNDDARRWTEVAQSQAIEAGDTRTASYVLMRQAQQSAEQGHGSQAVDLAEKAMSLDPGRLRTAALCMVRQAHGHALTRDARASRHALHQAARLLDRADATDADPDALDGHCTYLYLTAYEGICDLILDMPDQATRTLEQVLASWPDGQRQDEVMWRAWLSEGHAAAGRAPEASVEALRALEMTQMTGSARARKILGGVARSLARHDHVVEVGQFLAAHRIAAAAWKR